VTDFLQFAILGLGAGAAYSLLAFGIVVVYRGSGVVNFAHGAIAMVSSYLCFLTLQEDAGLPLGAAFIAAVLVAAAIGFLFQRVVLRLLAGAAPIVHLIATLGLLLLLQSAVELHFGITQTSVDQFLPNTVYDLGDLTVQLDRVLLAVVATITAAVLWVVTKYTRLGLAISASAENEQAVSSLGWSPNTLAVITWTVGAALGGVAGVMVAPLTGLSPATFTLVVTVSGLAAALLGGFKSFPLTLAGGLLLGIGESEVTRFQGEIKDFLGMESLTGLNRAVPFLVILLVLVVRGKSLPLRSHVNDRLPRLGSGEIRWVPLVVGAAATTAVALLVLDDGWSKALTVTVIAAVFVLSVVVLTGFAGQISLAQYALGGLGALFAAKLTTAADWPLELAFLGGVALAVPVGILIALPALRTRGVNLAVVTLGLGFTVQEVVFNNASLLGDPLDGGTRVGRARLFGVDVNALDHPDRWALVSVGVLVLCGLLVANLRRSRTGRRLLAVRTNERAAASLGISVFGVKIYAFAVSAVIAAVAGILLGFRAGTVTYGAFNPFQSINVIAQAVIGGIGYATGALFGALNAPGGLGTELMESLFDLGRWDVFIGGLLLIVLLILHRDGIADAGHHLLERVQARRSNRRAAAAAAAAADLPEGDSQPVTPKVLEVHDLVVRFGGVTAADGVSLQVAPGEVVGLIGPNGAGKTTVIDAVTGFVKPAEGTITLAGTPIGSWSAAKRSRGGLRRSFQSLELFEDLTVSENVHAGADEATWMSWVTDLVHPGRHPLPLTAATAIREFGLADHLLDAPGELPYGRRRLVGIARAVASGPSVLLLDEPAAGLDEDESGDLARLIRRLADDRQMGVLLVEHDVGLVMSTCDRVVVLDFGRVIADGSPAEVRDDPVVVAAYLGEDDGAAADDSPVPAAGSPTRVAPAFGDVLLESSALSAGYGDIAVVRDLDLRVRGGEVVALVGPNGAGKTTTLLTLAGDLAPLDGEVRWLGAPSTTPLHQRAREGLGFVPEERSVIMGLTAADNLKLAGIDAAEALRMFPELEEKLDRQAGLLSGGEQQMLTLARALGREPKLILADELSLGLAPLVVTRLLQALRKAATERGIGVLIVEQHVRQAVAVADQVLVMQRGRIRIRGTAAEVGEGLAELESAYLSGVT
jgi:sulfate-transporting ATPase